MLRQDADFLQQAGGLFISGSGVVAFKDGGTDLFAVPIVNSLASQITADVLEIEPAEKGLKYEANNYALGTQLLNAIKANPNDASSYPAINPVTVSLDDYQNIIIVTPLWWSQMAAIMQTYLFQNSAKLAGKTVAMIVSSHSSGISGVVADAQRLLPNVTWAGDALWTEAECEALYNYGYELGMAFQVADDYLDAFGDEKVFGKPIGGDIVNGKKSWLTVRTLEKTADKAAFLDAFALPADTPEQKAAKIAAVKDIYLQNGVDTDAKAEIVRFTDRALEAVSGVGFGPVKLEVLRRFAEKLVGRVS